MVDFFKLEFPCEPIAVSCGDLKGDLAPIARIGQRVREGYSLLELTSPGSTGSTTCSLCERLRGAQTTHEERGEEAKCDLT